MLRILKRIYDFVFAPLPEPKCKACNDSGQIEVIVMGTDTELVECGYCSDKPEYAEFQEYLKKQK